jgi:SAM-dependent methyltransferase
MPTAEPAVLARAAADRRLELLDRLPLPPLAGATVLDFGCGPDGFAASFPRLRGCGTGVGVVVGPDSPLPAPGVQYVQSAGDHLRVPTAAVDLVYAGDSLDRVPNTDLLLDEFHRVLKPGGSLALTLANADAYHDRLRGESAVSGADRPAAMGYAELLAYLAPRFDLAAARGYNREFYGYEVADPDFARGWSGLHPDRPDLAGGVVLVAVRRDGYTARGYVQDRVAYTSARVRYAGDWADAPIGGGLLARTGRGGATLNVTVTGDRLLLFLWAEPDAGRADVCVDGAAVEAVELAARVPGFRRVTLAGLRPGPHALRVTAAGPVTFRAAVGYQRP